MFGKMLRVGKGGHGLKYKIDVQVTQLENLPTSIRKCRVVWARSAKMQITDVKDVRGSVASFKQTLTQVTTVYRDKAGRLEAKEYEFKIQVPGKTSSDSSVTIGKATMDMAKYCKDETTSQSAMLPIPFKVGGSATGYLKMVITTVFLGDSNEDGLTEVSGLTGLTSDHGSVREQDLDGFADDDHAKFTKKSKSKRDDGSGAAAASTSGRTSAKPEASRRRKPLPPTAEEDDSDLDDQEQDPPPPAAKSSKKKSHHTRSIPEAGIPEEDGEPEENPFTKKVSKAPPKKQPPPKVWEDDEDISPVNSEVSDSEPPPPKAKKSKEPQESFDDMKNDLFATKKTSTAAAAGSAAAAGTSNSSSKAAGGKSSRVTLQPPVEEEDEESLRNDLFSAKPKATAAAPSSKSGAGKATAVGAAAAEAAAPAHTHKHRSKHKAEAAPPPPPPEYEDEYYDDDYGPSTSAAPAAPAGASSKSRGRTAEATEAPAAKGSSGLNRAGSSRAETSKGGSAMELEELRQRVSQLEKQLADEKAAKDDLSRKMQKYVDKIADLEDQVAEGDLTELFNQMREMEAKHQAEIKDMEAKYQAEIKELMERHLAEVSDLEDRHQAEVQELRAAAGSRPRGADNVSAEELKRLQSELREQEALLRSRTAKLEAEQAAANVARQAAESKLAEANKMIDDSLLVATRHQQENKALQEEVTRLKRQLEDASMWDTSAAVAAVTAASNNGRRGSDAEEELEELREKLEELQEENTRLQKLNEVTQQAAADMLRDINALLRDTHVTERFTNTTDSSSHLTGLSAGLRYLCDSYAMKSSQLRDMEARLEGLTQRAGGTGSDGGSSGGSKVKPHELLSRVHQLTAERDMLQEQLLAHRQAQTDLVAAQQLAASLQQQVDQLAAEKEAAERFKIATIAELRRENQELRNNLRSLSSASASPRNPFEDDGPASSRGASVSATLRSAAAGAAEGESNWQEFETLVAELKADRADLSQQVERLKADKASLGKQVQELRSSGGAAGIVRLADRHRIEELEQERAQLQADVERQQVELTRLQAQLAELSEADTVIKEWSDYADGLVADKARLEEQMEDLTRRLAAGTVATDVEAATSKRRAEELRRAVAEAEQRAESLARQAEQMEQAAASAESRLQELQRQLDGARAEVRDAERRAEDSQRRAALAQRQLEDAELQVQAAERRADEAEGHASEAMRRAEDSERRVQEAERRTEEALDVAAAAERSRESAAAYAVTGAAAATIAAGVSPLHRSGQSQQPHPADTAEVQELRHEISRLEASLSGLRLQLIESQSRTVSVAGDDHASSSHTRHRDLTVGHGSMQRSRWGQTEAAEDASSSGDSEDSPGPATKRVQSERGWHAEVEQLRARNASLEAVVAGLQATITSLQEEQATGIAGWRGSRRAERQLQELQTRLAAALQEKVELESTVVLLRSELEQTPLVRHGSIEAGALVGAATGVTAAQQAVEAAGLRTQIEALEERAAYLEKERSLLTANVASLRLEVEHLQEEKTDAERTVSRLSAEMEELAEALEASNNENERLSLEVLTLRDQVDQLEGGARSGSSHSQSARSSASGRGGSSRSSEPRDAAAKASAARREAAAAATAAERELAEAKAAVKELIWQINSDSGGGGDGFDDAPAFGGPAEQEDLAQALKALQVQIIELQGQSRQQRQAAASRAVATAAAASTASNASAVAAAEAQLAKANARIDELEQLLEDAEIENQHLTEQLEECLTGGRKGPDSVGSVAEECQSSYGGSVAAGGTGSNPYSYGHANTLTLSAFEQRLAMAEGRRDELSAALEDASATNRRLEADVAALQQQLTAIRRGQDPSALEDFDRPVQVPSRARGSRSASDSEDAYKKRIEELQSANRKLEAVCIDLEERAQTSQDRVERLQAELEKSQTRIRELEATVATLQKRLEEEAGAGGRQSKDKLADLESRVARLTREKAALEEQVAEERTLRQELEDTLKDKLDRDGDDEAAETVAAFEVKYNRLKERYKMLEESSQEELDELQDQLTEALGQVSDLQRQVKQLQAQLSQNTSVRAVGAAAVGSAASQEELRNLRTENERVVQQLVAKTMELAELSESEITVKRELARLYEVNMKLAQKATTLEAQVAMAQAANAKTTKAGKK